MPLAQALVAKLTLADPAPLLAKISGLAALKYRCCFRNVLASLQLAMAPNADIVKVPTAAGNRS